MLGLPCRLLDDNRELYVPELREAVRPHPHFMLFATQNPAGGAYAGRRPLSRAFRSRFLVRPLPLPHGRHMAGDGRPLANDLHKSTPAILLSRVLVARQQSVSTPRCHVSSTGAACWRHTRWRAGDNPGEALQHCAKLCGQGGGDNARAAAAATGDLSDPLWRFLDPLRMSGIACLQQAESTLA